MDECLAIVRPGSWTGSAVSFHGAFFDLTRQSSRCAGRPIPIIVGGRYDTEVGGQPRGMADRIWNRQRVAERYRAGKRTRRPGPDGPARRYRHAMQVWCGLADSNKPRGPASPP